MLIVVQPTTTTTTTTTCTTNPDYNNCNLSVAGCRPALFWWVRLLVLLLLVQPTMTRSFHDKKMSKQTTLDFEKIDHLVDPWDHVTDVDEVGLQVAGCILYFRNICGNDFNVDFRIDRKKSKGCEAFCTRGKLIRGRIMSFHSA